jgi:hypothetical protein
MFPMVKWEKFREKLSNQNKELSNKKTCYRTIDSILAVDSLNVIKLISMDRKETKVIKNDQIVFYSWLNGFNLGRKAIEPKCRAIEQKIDLSNHILFWPWRVRISWIGHLSKLKRWNLWEMIIFLFGWAF